jgi:hypothetical protein
MMPKRIQLSRKKGWRMPENTVKVDRTTKWGNPFVGNAREINVDSFRRFLTQEGAWCPIPVEKWPLGKVPAVFTTVEEVKSELRGQNLACWCRLCSEHQSGKPFDVTCENCAPCHADILIEISNQ